MEIAVTLKYRNSAALAQFIAAQSFGSATSHRWLTNEEFSARFSPSESNYLRLVNSLQAAGLRVSKTYSNRTVLDARGTVGQIERYFSTMIHDVEAGGHVYRVNVSPAVAPAVVRALVLSVDGLVTVPIERPQYKTAAPGRHGPKPQRGYPGWPILGPPSLATGFAGYGPRAFSGAYGLPALHADGQGKRYDGKGRAAAIVMDADYVDSDLTAFLKYFKITRSGPATTRVPIDGGSLPGNQAKDTIETTLDAETIVGNAPGTTLYVFELPALSPSDITDAYNTIVSANRVDVVSSSFAACELFVASSARAWNAIAQQAVAKGITFSASSGDAGGALCALAPASSPYFVAVGGSALMVGSGGSWVSESGWSGSGGGVSAVFPEPAWQVGVTGVVDRGRNVPDVAFDADPNTGTAFYIGAGSGWNSQFNPLGGTSLASPIYAAAVLEIDQVKNQRVGLNGQKLYAVWNSKGYGTTSLPYFHDITVGGNGAFYAAQGYDLVTGIGSVDFWNITSSL